MAVIKPRLKEKNHSAEGTLTYILERPDGFDYEPGQHVVIQMDVERSKTETGLRTFTLASSPTETNLAIVMREGSSAFKEKMQSLPKESPVTCFGPAGHFTYPEGTRPVVMIAGGIGVVPFRVFMKYTLDSGFDRKFVLLYSNPTLERTAFKDEFDRFAKNIENTESTKTHIKIVYTLTEKVPGGWTGERGRINQEMIQRHTSNLEHPLYYICGPDMMVGDIERQLLEMGVDKESIKSEKFTGY